jgi:hypothetical protein
MRYHILTPFNREVNMKLLLENFHRPGVIFHPLIDRPIEFPKEGWIEPFRVILDRSKKHPTFDIWNKFIGSGRLIDEDYYLFISDDDFLEPDFFEKIKNITTDVILVSMKRGDNITKSRYGTDTLIPHWHILMSSRIATEQLICKGKIIKNERFDDLTVADGRLIGRLWRSNPHKNFTFVEDTFVWFNYLEPGRWNSAPSPK